MQRTASTPIYDTANLRPNWLQEIYEAFQYRHLIRQLILRNITTRYKRSYLGVAWSMLNPLGMMLVMTVVFSAVFGRSLDYRVYLLTGLLSWGVFSEGVTTIVQNMIWGSNLLQRIYVPRTAFGLSSVGTALVNLALAMVPLFGLMLWVGVPIRPAVLFTPVPALLIILFTLGLGLALSVAAMYFADVNEMFKVVLRAWMYLTPIIYPETLLTENGYGWILRINPMYYLINVFRIPFHDGALPTWEQLWPALAIALVTFIGGWLLFNKYSDEFAYRV